MIVDCCQRWRGGRASYRPAGETIVTARYEVSPIEDDTTAKAFVVAHHYAKSYPAARFRVGLYTGGALVGVAVLSVPMSEGALRPFHTSDAVELGRLVLLDAVPANGESWFLGRVFELLRAEGLGAVVSFSDPEVRTNAAGVPVFLGHAGTCYQASNAVYTGKATPRTLHLLPDGTVLSARTVQKIRARERGWHHAVAQLVAHGASAPANDTDLRAWLAGEMPRVTRRRRHGGNHRYLFPLDRSARRACPASLPYPKLGRDLFGARVA